MGPLHTVSLADAREKARVVRTRLAEGIDPFDQRRENLTAKQAEQGSNLDFLEDQDRNRFSCA